MNPPSQSFIGRQPSIDQLIKDFMKTKSSSTPSPSHCRFCGRERIQFVPRGDGLICPCCGLDNSNHSPIPPNPINPINDLCGLSNPDDLLCFFCNKSFPTMYQRDGMVICEDCWEKSRPSPTPSTPSLVQKALELVSKDRREDYGPAKESFQRIASIWTAILNHPVSPHQVALMMAGLKLSRESWSSKEDNLVDLIGYAVLAGELASQKGQQ